MEKNTAIPEETVEKDAVASSNAAAAKPKAASREALPTSSPNGGNRYAEQAAEERRNPQGNSGRTWSKVRGDYMRAISKIGNADKFVTMQNQFYKMEQRKISQHMKSAVALSQVGNMSAAAQQLQAVGFYMDAGTLGKVTPGPRGSFVVQNFDEETGAIKGGYAVTPKNVMEMAMALDNIQDYGRYTVLRDESAERVRQNWEKVKIDRAKALLEMDKTEVEIQNLMIDQASKKLGLNFDIATGPARLAKAGADADKAEADATSAMVKAKTDLSSFEDTQSTKLDTFGTDVVQGMQDEIGAAAKRMLDEAGAVTIGEDGNPLDPSAASAEPGGPQAAPNFNEAGGRVEMLSPEAQQLGITIAKSLKAADSSINVGHAKSVVSGLILSPRTEFEFFGDPNKPSGEGNPTGVFVNGQRYDLRPTDMAQLEAALVTARKDALDMMNEAGQLDKPGEAYMHPSGRGFQMIPKSELIRQAVNDQLPDDPAIPTDQPTPLLADPGTGAPQQVEGPVDREAGVTGPTGLPESMTQRARPGGLGVAPRRELSGGDIPSDPAATQSGMQVDQAISTVLSSGGLTAQALQANPQMGDAVKFLRSVINDPSTPADTKRRIKRELGIIR